MKSVFKFHGPDQKMLRKQEIASFFYQLYMLVPSYAWCDCVPVVSQKNKPIEKKKKGISGNFALILMGPFYRI